MLDGKGRVAMISGAARGIGRAVAERLAAAGYAISAGVRDPGVPLPAGLNAFRYEATEAGSAETWVAATLAALGRIDVLVNAAGIASPPARLLDPDEAGFDAMWAVNTKGPLRVIRAAWPHLIAAGEGRIVNIASLSGKRVKNENVGYAMSKFALVALTHAVRREGFAHGIRACALCPGFVATDMSAHVITFPRERMSSAADIAALAEAVIRLPNTASVAELLVNCQLEEML
jgi:NAD(P)-dependent dehydrogenase (short-subunit alcohol dehydrogenase family)